MFFVKIIRINKKILPYGRGGFLGGVIENDFLMCRIDSALIHSQSPNQKVEAAGVEPASKLGARRLSTRLFCA